ncbi:MAG: mechanosensitive ion channel domain-containing protein [Chloroflexota bacterium]
MTLCQPATISQAVNVFEEGDVAEPTGSTGTIVKHAALTLVFAGLLLVVPALTKTYIDETPYETYVTIAEVLILGGLAVEFGARWVHAMALMRTAQDVAAAIRIIARIGGYAVIISAVVSLLTENAAAALTAGSFAGLVAGLATQSVLGNAVAGVFLAVARPVRVGDSVTIGANSGTIINITLMHLVLQTPDRDILIPSSTVVTSVLVRHRPPQEG